MLRLRRSYIVLVSLLQLPSSFHSIYAICLTNELDETGTYTLASDAALVYDTFCKQAFGDEHETNFATAQDHTKFRDAELKSRGLDVDFDEVQAHITKKVNRAISKLNRDRAQQAHPLQRSER